MTGDEALYFHAGLLSAKHGNFIMLTNRHVLFQLSTAAATFIFGLDNVFEYILFTFIQSVFWNILCQYIIYNTLNLITTNKKVVSLSILTVPFIFVYTVMNSLYLAEVAGLFFCFLGVNLLLRFFQRRKGILAFASGMSFVASYLYREPFLIFVVLNVLLFVYLTMRKKVKLHYLILFCIPLIFVRFPVDVLPMPFLPHSSLVELGLEHIFNIKYVSPTLLLSNGELHPAMQYQPSGFHPGGTFSLVGNFQERLVNTLVIFAKGMFFGWSMIFLLFLSISIVLFCIKFYRKQSIKDAVVIVTVLAALLSFGLLAFMLSTDPYLATMQGTSISFRFSYTTLPSLLVLPFAYKKFGKKHIVMIASLLCILTVAFHPHFLYAMQSNQSLQYENRISLGYVAPYRRLYNYIVECNQQKIAVFADPVVRASLYIWMTDATLYRIAINESKFDEILSLGYDKTLFYGEKWYGYWQTMKDHSPFYYSLISNQSSYKLETIWDDNESHLYMLRNEL